MRIKSGHQQHQQKPKNSQNLILEKKIDQQKEEKCSQQEKQMRHQMPHLINGLRIRNPQSFFNDNERKFNRHTIILVRKIHQFLTAREDIIIIQQPELVLNHFV